MPDNARKTVLEQLLKEDGRQKSVARHDRLPWRKNPRRNRHQQGPVFRLAAGGEPPRDEVEAALAASRSLAPRPSRWHDAGRRRLSGRHARPDEVVSARRAAYVARMSNIMLEEIERLADQAALPGRQSAVRNSCLRQIVSHLRRMDTRRPPAERRPQQRLRVAAEPGERFSIVSSSEGRMRRGPPHLYIIKSCGL
jgi:hypothetical protein